MSTVDPYVPAHPGGLITAELWNDMQRRIHGDIGARIEKAVADLKRVDRSGDADKLGGKTPEELAKEIIARALGEIPRRTGYRRVFTRLPIGRPGDMEYTEIKHDLKAFPVLNVLQLDPFQVICRADTESSPAWVHFYLYHTSEKRIGRPQAVTIQESRGPVFRLPFFATLAELGVEYQEDDSLADLVNEFWKKLFSAPSDEFDESHHCHSPWWQRCCSDDRTVADIRRAGDENDLWLKLKPRMTINYPRSQISPALVEAVVQFRLGNNAAALAALGRVREQDVLVASGIAVPPDIEVVHFDLDTVGIRVVPPGEGAASDVYLSDPRAGVRFEDAPANGGETKSSLAQDDLAVMVLLQAGAPAVGGAGPGGGAGQPAAY